MIKDLASLVNGNRGLKDLLPGVPMVAQLVMNPTGVHEDVSLIPGFARWVKDQVQVADSLDPPWLWLRCRPAAAIPI